MYIYLNVIFLMLPNMIPSSNTDAQKYSIRTFNDQLRNILNMRLDGEWNYNSNMTAENLNLYLANEETVYHQLKQLWNQVTTYHYKGDLDPETLREIELFSKILGPEVLSQEEYREYKSLKKTISSTTSNVILSQKLTGTMTENEVVNILRTSKNPKELSHIWKAWSQSRDIGMKPKFAKYVELTNKIATLSNLKDVNELWLQSCPEFAPIQKSLKNSWKTVNNLHRMLHAFGRHTLHGIYGDFVNESLGIPISLIGCLFGQHGANVIDNVLSPAVGKTYQTEKNMVKQGFTPLSMIKDAEHYVESFRFPNLPLVFWKESIFELVGKDRKILQTPTVYSLYSYADVKAIGLLKISINHYFKAQHIVASAHFSKALKQPTIFQDPPLPGFESAIAESFVLSVRTTSHLNKFGILVTKPESKEDTVIHLLYLAFYYIPKVAYYYWTDLWRMNVFSGEVKPEDYYRARWAMRYEFHGIQLPDGDDDDLYDIGMGFQMVDDTPLFSRFFNSILVFQIYRALCTEAGLYLGRNVGKPLHECDIFGSVEAGSVLKKVLFLGRSKPLPDVLELLTGERSVNVSALVEFFEPATEFLKKENERNGVVVGWSPLNERRKKQLRFFN